MGNSARFAGQRVWITGASAGIGSALARALAAEGARLVLTARRADRLATLAASLGPLVATNQGSPAQPAAPVIVPADLAARESLPQVADAAWAAHGGLDLVIHNAGIGQRGLALETTPTVLDQIMAVNFTAPVLLSQCLIPRMLASGGGRIVVVSSVLGKFGMKRRSAYAASKHALHGYFDSLRAELTGQPLGITLICPGYVHTEISLSALKADGSAHGTLDEGQRGGISADTCAAQILRAILANKTEANVGGWEVLAVLGKRLFPGWFTRFANRFEPI